MKPIVGYIRVSFTNHIHAQFTGEVVGVVFFIARRHRSEMFEFVEEAFTRLRKR